MNILTLNHEFPPIGGGAAPVTLHLARHLVQLGHEVDVVTMHFGNLPKQETIEGVRVYRVPAFRRRPDLCRIHEMASYLIGARFFLSGLLKQKQYHLIHAHFIIPAGPLGVQVKNKTGCPLVITMHGSDVPGYNPDRFRFAHKCLLPVWKRLVHQVDQLVSPSGHLKELVCRWCPTASVRIIPNGFDENQFDSGVPKRPQILACSRILPRKGFQYLVEAAKELPSEWEIHIAGDGPYLPTLKKQAEKSGVNIHFHGWLSPNDPLLKQLYESSWIFVFPSEEENFPTVLLEALGAGCAIITTLAGGCPEVAGSAALYVKPRDAQELKEALLRLIADESLRCELSQKARRRIEHFSWRGVARQYAELFEQLVDAAAEKRRQGPAG